MASFLSTPGPAATVEVGTVTKGAPGSEPTVTNSGSAYAAVLDFQIPEGDPGTVTAASQGTEEAPGIAFGADPSTGLYQPALGELGVAVDGRGVALFDASGNLGLLGCLLADVSGNASTADLAAAATALATPRAISVSGDASGNGVFDGTGDLDLAVTLSSTGVTPGSYNTFTVDAKGRITAASTDNTRAPLNSPALTGTPTAPTAAAGTNTTQLATTAFVRGEVAALVDASPAALDTLNELAAALGDDPNFATTISNQIGEIEAEVDLKAPLQSPALTGTPTAPTAVAGSNSTQIANTAFVRGEVNALISGAPASLNTLNELAAAINNDPAYATTVSTALATKAPVVSPTFTGTPSAPTASAGTNTTQLATTAFVTQAQTAAASATETRLAAKVDAVAGSGAITASTVSTGSPSVKTVTISLNDASTTVSGAMPAADKTKLDAATAQATASTLVMRDAGGNFSAGTITAALSGNATTATALQTARTINGTNFNGTSNITITANTPNSLTFNNLGSGANSGSTFNGGSGITISYNTIGAAASSHVHGNISNSGAIGTTANLPVITTTNGVLTTGAFGTTASTFCEGNDARLSNTRTPTDFSVTDAKVATNATISGTKINPNFGTQNVSTSGSISGGTIVTTGNATAAALIPTSSAVPSYGIYCPATNIVGIAADGSLVLEVNSNGAFIAGSLITSHDSYNAHQVQASTVTGQLSANAGSAAIEIRAVSDNPIALYTNNLERARLTTDGHFGIGTSLPSAPLHVAVAPATASSGNIYITPGTGAGQARCRLYNNGGVTEWIFGQKSATDHAFTISSQVAGVDTDYITVSHSETTPMVVFRESLDVKLGTGFGTRLGTQPIERLGFWGANPTTRPTAVANATDATSVIARLNDLLSRLRTIGLIAWS